MGIRMGMEMGMGLGVEAGVDLLMGIGNKGADGDMAVLTPNNCY